MKKIVFIADYFVEHVLGGGELNNEEIISILQEKKYIVEKIQSHLVNKQYIKKNKKSFFIISNFINLPFSCKELLCDLEYIIYEHDHKYIRTRNPAFYKNYLAPPKDIVNYYFYKN